jgi:penicillin amidase
MKFIKHFFIALLTVILLFSIVIYFWFRSTAPDYYGTMTLKGLKYPVKVIYDEYGVPHIEAKNAEDAYMTLGYVQAQDRLFQMEMIRRVALGNLSEILGKELVSTDKMLRNLSLKTMAERAVKKYFGNGKESYQKETLAYIQGVNRFIDEGNLPVEFTLIGFKPKHFTVEDVYATIGYMAFTFTSALTQDPAVTDIKNKLGNEYLKLFNLDSTMYKGGNEEVDIMYEILNNLKGLQDFIPVPIWDGSNSWVVSKERSKSGKPILANDTHIKYSQPAVWYEAVIHYPDYTMSGYYIAGIPYAIVGNTNMYAWGITIFPFDNMDLYKEKINTENSTQVWQNDHWQDMYTDKQIIKVKDEEEIVYNIKYTRHGPVMNEAYPQIADEFDEPVTMWWSMNHLDVTALQALYYINNAKSFEEFEKGVSLIDVLGLNVIYADINDNIAWWAAGRLPKRPDFVNPSFVLDGSSGKYDVEGYYPFSKNPHSVNPEDGLLETSNNQPPAIDGYLYPGYYPPGYRAKRAVEIINTQDKWSAAEMKRIQLDNVSERDRKLAQLVLDVIGTERAASKNAVFEQAVNRLNKWDGNSNIDNVAVTIYTKMLYYIAENAMADELGQHGFEKFVSSNLVRSAFEKLFVNPDCIWWDNINTPQKETRKLAFRTGFDKAVISLQQQFGDDVSQWQWGNVHLLTHIHPIGRKEPFDKIFNVGPFPVNGTNEVIDKESIHYNKLGIYPVISGPALRMIVDLANPEEKFTIIPTGQSGNFMSPYYSDQAEMFVEGKYRILKMDLNEKDNYNILLINPLND